MSTGIRAVEKRAQEILEITAQAGMKSEVAHLFKKMSAMPTTRRMSVMPGVKLEEEGVTLKVCADMFLGEELFKSCLYFLILQASVRQMSILPKEKEEDKLIMPPSAGGEKGKEKPHMIDLIQYHIDT